ncbi:hypothetical protein RFI_06151, partial [Reticulomyxa filosa]
MYTYLFFLSFAYSYTYARFQKKEIKFYFFFVKYVFKNKDQNEMIRQMCDHLNTVGPLMEWIKSESKKLSKDPQLKTEKTGKHELPNVEDVISKNSQHLASIGSLQKSLSCNASFQMADIIMKKMVSHIKKKKGGGNGDTIP